MAKSKLSDRDWQRYYGSEGLWRNDNNAQDRRYDSEPTVSTIVTHAEDEIGKGKHYGFGIRHVRGFHGKGFMPHLWFLLSADASGGNGEVFYGTDQDAYNKALAQGRELVDKWDGEMEAEMSKYEVMDFFRPVRNK